MTIKQVCNLIENEVPLNYAEDFDNVGLLVGDCNNEVTRILVTLDTLEDVVDEAIEKGCNLIVSFHPIIFKGLKKITGANYVERVVLKAIKNNIAIYAIHTALDNHLQGVNDMICDKLGLINREILIPKAGTIKKLNTYVPNNALEKVQQALFDIGAGSIGNYSDCSFINTGIGSFKANDKANPTIGEKNKLHRESESQLQLTFASHLQSIIIQTLHNTHPYEEVAYEITTLENTNQKIGMGMIGELKNKISERQALELIKITFNCGGIRHSKLTGKNVKRIAVLGGSGAFAIENAKRAKADIYITADVKYHEFYQAENKLIIADIGHYESEQYTKNLIVALLRKKISNFAPIFKIEDIILSEINSNPIKYF